MEEKIRSNHKFYSQKVKYNTCSIRPERTGAQFKWFTFIHHDLTTHYSEVDINQRFHRGRNKASFFPTGSFPDLTF